MTDCGRWVCFGPQRQGFNFDPRTGQKIDSTPTPGGWDPTMKLEPPERANKIMNKAMREISAKKRAVVEARDYGAITDIDGFGENHGMRSSQAAGFQPVRPEISTNSIENNLEPTDLEDTEDEDNADERESGGMRARPQPR